jgi:two-component system, LytTR family, sensor kinase
MVGLGIVITLLFRFVISHKPPPHPFVIELFIITVVVVVLWEGNLQITRWLDFNYSWMSNARRRLLLQVLVTLVASPIALIIFINLFHLFMDRNDGRAPKGIDPLLIPGILITVIIISVEIGTYFFTEWKKSLLEAERYKAESANAQLQNLKEQINPHFLFNNLSVLTSLVRKDQEKAIVFINELSKVYRYVLENKSAELVELKEELQFLDHYFYLLKIRFDSSISFNLRIDESLQNYYMPPMCLQMLVENTIQHNEASQAKPLEVSIFSEKFYLIIENPIQPRSDARASSQTGLANIQSRYAFFTEQKVEIVNNENVFRVKLPLLTKS